MLIVQRPFKTVNDDISAVLTKELYKEDSNFCVSPYGVSQIMGMLYSASSNNTKNQFNDKLGISEEAYAKEVRKSNNGLQSYQETTIENANSIWISSNAVLSDSYKEYAQNMMNYYDASSYTFDSGDITGTLSNLYI